MSDTASRDAREPPAVDVRLVQWMAVQALQDRYARLAEGGANIGTQVELASLFIDLPVSSLRPSDESQAVRLLLAGRHSSESESLRASSSDRPARWLLVGGPGSGKSTLTTMLAQQLRTPWVDRQLGALPEHLANEWLAMGASLRKLAEENAWAPDADILPLRVNLPSLARWMATHREVPQLSLWHFLAARLVADLASRELTAEVSAPELRALAEQRATIFWIFDGLDEVPSSAGRSDLIELVRASVCETSGRGTRLLVATRPQGYGGEFDELDPLVLQTLNQRLALGYGERLLRAWLGSTSVLEERRAQMRIEFSKADVAELLHSPLHTTMAAILVAREGSLPNARCLLFEHYFKTIFERELGKPFEHGIQRSDEGIILALHTRAGLALHVRSQEQTGARPSLRRRDLRALLVTLYEELGVSAGDVRERVDRIMRFAADRLVLLLHASEGEYEFGVRSLQEYFAALGLMEGETAVVHERLAAVVLAPHWSNVLAFVVSHSALKISPIDRTRALQYTVALCRALNDGTVGGTTAARCLLGSRLAMWMLQETEAYGLPWLHAPLWDIALQIVDSPSQTSIRPQAGWCRSNDFEDVHNRLGKLAAAWSRDGAQGYRQRLFQAAESLLARADDEGLLGWHLLAGGLDKSLDDAVRIADAHAPADRERAQEVVDVLSGFWCSNLSPWTLGLFDEHAEWFPPSWLINHLFIVSPGEMPDIPIFKPIDLLRKTPPGIHLTWPSVESGAAALVTSIDGNFALWTDDLEALIADPRWALWKRISRFSTDPSSASLADILEAASKHPDAFDELLASHGWLPWPISACARHAPTPEACAALAAELHAGRYGSTEEWRAAEQRWRTSSKIVWTEVGASITCDGPWNHDIASRGRVVTHWPPADQPPEAFQRLSAWIETESPAPRAALLLLHDLVDDEHSIPLSVALRIEEDDGDRAGWQLRNLYTLLPDLDGPDADGWVALLDRRGRSHKNVGSSTQEMSTSRLDLISKLPARLIEHMYRRPDRWGLCDALVCFLKILPDTDISDLDLSGFPDAPPRALGLRALVTLLSGRFAVADIPDLVRQLQSDPQDASDLAIQLATILGQRTWARPHTTDILLAVLNARPPFRDAARDATLGALYAVQQRLLQASFATLDAWRQHTLPEPFLAGQAPSPSPPWLKSIELSNIRLFRTTPDIDVPFPQPTPEHGQRLVLVGENGVGKTTLLRALGLALTSPATASKLLDERFPMLSDGREGRIALELNTGKLAIAVRREDRTEVIESTIDGEVSRPWVVGYGVRRGNARGDKARETEVGPIGELHSLFERPSSLHNASQWLRELEGSMLREQRRTTNQGDSPGPRERTWGAVLQALRTLLGIKKLEVDEAGLIQVTHAQFGRVRLDALSDGYLTTAGWVLDMIARWVERQQELDEPIGADLLRQMCGFVLLDEIDLHLHPIWQLRILEEIRRLFPRLSFVVTTHNPLTLQGARAGEVYILRRNEGRIELVQRDIRPGHDFDRVLLEQFGIAHTFDRETRDILTRHRTMLEQQVPPTDPERLKLEATLRERLGDVSLKAGNPPDVSQIRPDEQALLDQFLEHRS